MGYPSLTAGIVALPAAAHAAHRWTRRWATKSRGRVPACRVGHGTIRTGLRAAARRRTVQELGTFFNEPWLNVDRRRSGKAGLKTTGGKVP